MYKLTLTRDERQVFDFVAGRYSIGDIPNILMSCMDEDVEWTGNHTITFDVPEYLAWEILQKYDDDGQVWTCFGPELTRKMQNFVDSIV